MGGSLDNQNKNGICTLPGVVDASARARTCGASSTKTMKRHVTRTYDVTNSSTRRNNATWLVSNNDMTQFNHTSQILLNSKQHFFNRFA